MSERYFDRDGAPISLLEWGQKLEHNRQVADTTVGSVRVSTVWLGLNHNWGDGPPLIFETMVFEGPDDGWLDRYATLEEAEAGHAEVVRRLEAGEGLPD